MRLDSTGLGVGTSSPNQKLTVVGGVSVAGAATLSAAQGSLLLSFESPINRIYIGDGTGYSLAFSKRVSSTTTDLMTLTDSGNLGLGVTPSAWSGLKAFEFAGVGSSLASASNNNVFLSANAWYNGTNWSYGITAAASQYQSFGGAHAWFTAPSGTAGNAITFSQVMTLDASGNLGVGATSITPVFGRTVSIYNAAAGGTLELGGSTITTRLYASEGASAAGVGTTTNTAFQFITNNTERARITSGGNFQTSSGGSVQVGGTAARATTAGTNRVDIFDGTAPVGTLANGVSFYSTAGEARVMDAAGNATLLSPHDTETNEWIFHSKHTPTGKVLRIDVERLLRFVNAHFGLDAVKEFVEE
jgi:hypothetical protein